MSVYEDEDYERYCFEQAEREWNELIAEGYEDHLIDCEETGETPMSLKAFEEDYIDSQIAEYERRAEEGL